MLLLKSLFCFTGADNRRRFIIIHTSCYFLFAIISSISSANSLLSFIALFFFIALCTYSTKRRLNDANLNKTWLYAPAIGFLIAGLFIILTDSSTSYWLLIFPLTISALLMTYKSNDSHQHILGYYGSIDLSAYIKQEYSSSKIRIEPTFNQSNTRNSQVSISDDNSNVFSKNIDIPKNVTGQSDRDIGEAIRLKLLNHKKALFTIVILVFLVIMAMILSSVISSSAEDKSIVSHKNEVSAGSSPQQVKLHETTLPDDFSLFVSSFDGITIKWQGDITSKAYIWQQLTAQGDESCKAIVFNNGETIRTLQVTQENGSDYFANFSPLDTEAIIKSIAIRGNFSLCGYKFSLKGSQSVLGKHQYYSKFFAH